MFMHFKERSNPSSKAKDIQYEPKAKLSILGIARKYFSFKIKATLQNERAVISQKLSKDLNILTHIFYQLAEE